MRILVTQAVPATVRCTVRAPACTSALVRMGDVGRGPFFRQGLEVTKKVGTWKDHLQRLIEASSNMFQSEIAMFFFFPVPAFLDFFGGIRDSSLP